MRKVRTLLFLILVSLPAFLGQFSFTVFAQTPTKICNASFGATWYGQVYVKGYLEIMDNAGGCLTGIAGQTVTSSYMYKIWGPNGCYYSDYYGQGTTDNSGYYYFQYGPWGAPKVLSIEVDYEGNSQYQPAQWVWNDLNPSDYCPRGS